MAGTVHALVRILADGRFHSGTRLGEMLGISRAAIWKHIDKVADLGLEVHSVRGKGYRLSQPLDLLDRQAIAAGIDAMVGTEAGLPAGPVQHLEVLESVDSTNTHAMRLLQDNTLVPENDRYAVFLAEQQTSGKGRRGRLWVSPYGQNLYMTLVRLVDTANMRTDGLSLVTGLALVRALKTLGVEGLAVKWPNDVLHEGRKLAGILLEISGDITGICQLVVGVGVNVRCRPQDMADVGQPWTDLYQAAGRAIARNQLVAAVVTHIMQAMAQFEQQGMAGFMDEWASLDALKDRQVELVSAAGSRFGRARGISDTGALLLDTGAGVESINGGEISLRGIPVS